MKLPHINASEETMWKWFDVPGFKEASAELKLLTRSDMLKLQEFEGKLKEEGAYVAKHFFRDFRGCADANGTPLPNTEEIRAQMMEDMLFGTFVTAKLGEIVNWRAEGKEESGSAS